MMPNTPEVQDRNIRALEQTMRTLHDDVRDMKQRLDSIVLATSNAMTRFAELERMVHQRLASSLGNGPTKKG